MALDTEIVVEERVPVRAEGDDDARLCLADGSVLELAPNTAAAMRPAEDRSRLLIELQEGEVVLLARQTPYGFTTSACPVRVSDVPARLRVELREGVTHVMVEQGSAVCATGSEPTLLPTCWELVAAPGAEPEVAQYCGLAGEVPPTETPAPTSAPPATAAPTPEPSPAATSAPAEATETPEPTPIP
jgi:ferric-dicitrate binding protein FerR (iron transport regulator)